MEQKLTFKNGKLFLNDEEFFLRSGSIHYFRIHPTQWRDRLLKLKKCGLNTVETYIPWNLQEPKPGEFCFEGIADFESFISTAEELGLYVIVRPGPYICAEWEMGGLPSWLLNIEGIKLRHYNKPFLDCIERYFTKIVEILRPHFSTNGGRIIALQAENEYGGLEEPDKEYLNWVHDTLVGLGVDVLMFTSDGVWKNHLEVGSIDNVLMTANFGSKAIEAFDRLEELRPGEPKICMEFWNGWFDQWGVPHHTRNPEEPVRELKSIIDAGGHFNIYMFSGGTNFGFLNGSNCNPHFEPCITSYDYGAALSEEGKITEQYRLIAKLLGGEVDEETVVSKSYGKITEFKKYGMIDNAQLIGRIVASHDALCMEQCGQSFGYIMYEADIKGYSGLIDIGEPHDRAMFYCDDEFVGEYERGTEFELINVSGKTHIKVLIENMGHINYGPKIYDRKGLLENMKIGGKEVTDYKITSFEFKTIPELEENADMVYPSLFSSEFSVDEIADTYLVTNGFTKGVAFINGFNLGRYWNKGPQQTLYVPAGVLNKAKNKIVVLDLYPTEKPEVEFVDYPILDKLV